MENDSEDEKFLEKRGSLCMRIGPMFSSKTTWLNNTLTVLCDIGLNVLKIMHNEDNRANGSTHNSSYGNITQKIRIIKTKNLKDVDVTDYNVIGIDEAQFFDDLLEMVEIWVEKYGKHVKVVGLDGDFLKRKFGQTLDLIPLCDEVIKVTAKCEICSLEAEKNKFERNIIPPPAPFTRRMEGSKEQKEVGGKEKYIAVCRLHHNDDS